MNSNNKFWGNYLSSGLQPLAIFIAILFLISIINFLIYQIGGVNPLAYSILNMVIILPILGMFGAFVFQVKNKLWKVAVLNFLLLFWIFFIGYCFIKSYSH